MKAELDRQISSRFCVWTCHVCKAFGCFGKATVLVLCFFMAFIFRVNVFGFLVNEMQIDVINRKQMM